jgi:hypothetical protein
VTSQYQPRLSSITIFLQYLHQIKLYLNKMKNKEYHSVGLNREKKMIPLTDTWPLNFLAWYKQRKKMIHRNTDTWPLNLLVWYKQRKKMIPLTDTWPLNLLAWYKQRKNIQQYFSYIMAFSIIGGGNWSTRRKPLTCHKSMTIYQIMLYRVHLIQTDKCGRAWVWALIGSHQGL